MALVAVTIIAENRQSGVQSRSTGVATVGGPFQLTGTEGQTVSEQDLLGKPSAVFFGFTYCPDVCPTTLFELTTLAEQLGSEADKLNFVFVSVDSERDGPAEMKQYLEAFDDRIIGLTGTAEQIDAVAKAYKIYHAKVPLEGGDYTMDHTASVILMDADGRFFGTMDYEEEASVMLAKLKRLISERVDG
jgi:protein SCO1/2